MTRVGQRAPADGAGQRVAPSSRETLRAASRRASRTGSPTGQSVVGKTTPNSIIFTDGPTTNSTLPTGNFKFQGIAVASDSQGNFEYPVKLTGLSRGGSLTGTAFLVRTPFGQQTIRSFPIRRLP